jgi:prophage regulatory protein
MLRDRAYPSDIAAPTTRMSRLASTSRGAADPARLFACLPTVMQATGLGRSTIYRLVATGEFPRPVHLGPRAIAWRWSDLEQWSATRATHQH